MSDRHKKQSAIAGAASIVGGATLLSRVFGYVRDAVIAYMVGAGMQADAFFVAFRLSNLLRRLVGEGALTQAFIPIFTEELGKRSREEASRLASKVFTVFFLILVAISVLGIIFSPQIVAILAPGFTDDPEKLKTTIFLTRVMFPYTLLIGLVAIAMGVLNSLRHFAAPALSPVLLNICIIVVTLAGASYFSLPIYAVAAGVLLGGVAQLALQMPFLTARHMTPRPVLDVKDPALGKIFALMGPAALSAGIYQINVFVVTRFASDLAEGSVSYLYYATRLIELPLGVFGVALGTAVLPSLSEYVAKKDWDSFHDSLGFALRMVNFVTIPATVGLFVIGRPIIDVLFTRGEFGATDAFATSIALYYFAVGLIFVAGARILVSVFYSLKDTKTPVLIALASSVVNIGLCIILKDRLGHGGLALAVSASALVSFGGLLFVLRSRRGPIGAGAILFSSLKSLVASIAMGIALFVALKFLYNVEMALALRFVLVIAMVVIGGCIYVGVARILRAEEVDFVVKMVLRKGRGKGSEGA